MIKRILLALGGTPFSHAGVRLAVELAHAHHAALTAVTILDASSWKAAVQSIGTASAAARLIEDQPWEVAKRRLDRMIAEFHHACRDARVDAHVIRPDAQPLRHLTEQSRYHDLILFGLRGLFDYTLVPQPEQTITDLIRQGVHPVIAAARRYRQVRRAMIAYSGSMESASAMKRFLQTGLWPEAELHIVCCDRPAAQAEQLLAEAKGCCEAHGRDVHTEAVNGSPHTALLAHAHRLKVDLIVLGDSHRATLVRHVMGDTLSHIIRDADRPLFISH